MQTMSWQDIFQTLTISVLAGLFWLQSGQDNTLVGCVPLPHFCLVRRTAWLQLGAAC